jgi:glycosyltransferase involved in cell wall biosynthesis
LVVNEAMASGLPVIASSGCGCAVDLIDQGRNGYVFSPESSTMLCTLLHRMDAMDEADWTTMRNSAQKKIQSWGLTQFANSTIHAMEYAKKKYRRGHSFIHRLLSKR